MGRHRAQEPEVASNYDHQLIFVVVVLLLVGLWMVYSVTEYQSVTGYDIDPDGGLFGSRFVTQVIASLIGVFLAVVLARIEYHFWRRYSIPILLLTIAVLGAVLLFGHKQNNSQSWVTLGGSIQPSEAAKLAMIMYVAHWLSSKGARIQQLTYGLIPFTGLLGLIFGLILLQNDFGTAVLIAITALAMFFIAGGAVKQLAGVIVLGSIVAGVAVKAVGHRLERITSFIAFDPTSPTYSQSVYQLKQGVLALGLGGVSGRGLGDSIQKMGYIPAAHTDSIFAVLGEEMGLIGCLVILGLFAWVAYRGFSIALRSTDQYGTLLAAGVTCSLLFQALVNIGVVTVTIPATGVPLPFISYGGTSLVVSLASIGLLLSVSRRTLPESEEEVPAQSTLKESHAYHETYDLGRRHRGARLSRPGRRRLADKR